MKQLTSLLWKEWHEARIYMWVGLGLFLGMPLIGGLEGQLHTRRPFEIVAAPWVVYLGGVLAVFVAVGITTRDLRPKLDDFWRSRPIRVLPWLATKYAVGLAIVLVACEVPLVVELALDRMPDVSIVALICFPFFWAAVFSLAFLAAAVVVRPAHAATLGLAALLLVYTVPVTVPPLSWLNVADAIDPPYASGDNGRWMFGGLLWGRQLAFAGGMIALAAMAAAVGAVAVRRGWRVDSGRKLMYGLVAAAFLLLFTSAAFQLASNLPVLQRVDLPTDSHEQRIVLLRLTGPDRGFVVTNDEFGRQSATRPSQPEWWYWYHPFKVGPAGINLGEPVRYPDDPYIPWSYGNTCVMNGDLAYRVDVGNPQGRDDVWVARLTTIDTRTGTGRPMKLWEQPVEKYSQERATATYLWRDRLFVIGRRLDVFDVSRPDQPRRVSDEPVDLTPPATTTYTPWADREIITLLPLPGLPAAQRLEATLRVRDAWGRPSYAFDGTVYCRTNGHASAYRLTRLDDVSATFEKIGQARPTPLQRWVTPYIYGTPSLRGGLLYVDTNGWGDTFNGSLSIFDTAGPRPMRRVGHFAAPGAQYSVPLPDGRAIVAGGNRLWLVGAPKRSS